MKKLDEAEGENAENGESENLTPKVKIKEDKILKII